jgi:hypothetical protein
MAKTFIAKLEIDKHFLEICHEDETFYLPFRMNSDDDWLSFTMKDGSIYDVHLLLEDFAWEVSIYGTRKTGAFEEWSNIELIEVDTSDLQELRLYFE